MANNMGGGAAGRWFDSGHVYVMKDVTGQMRNGHRVQMFKIGHSQNPQQRLQQIQMELHPNVIQLLGNFPANEANGAETAAQNAAKNQLGFEKDKGRGNATDWFLNPKKKNHEEILKTVEKAVKNHNKSNKK